MTTPASRLITLIQLLQNRPNQKAAELAEALGVSVRTLHRYLSELDGMGIPVYAERGPYGGFALVRGFKLPPLVFTPEEAAAVCLGTGLVEAIWGELYREAARAALAKLENLLPEEQRREVVWARRTFVSTGLQRGDPLTLSPILENLRQSARQHLRVELRYRSRGRPEPEAREVDPYALVHRWGWWYLVGYCHSREAVRTFRLDRIAALSTLEKTFEPPQDFDAQAFLAHASETQPTIPVQVSFSPEMAAAAREHAFGWEKLEAQPDGSVVVTLLAPDVEWAASTVLAYGPGVRVLAPEAVRQTVREWAAAIQAQY